MLNALHCVPIAQYWLCLDCSLCRPATTESLEIKSLCLLPAKSFSAFYIWDVTLTKKRHYTECFHERWVRSGLSQANHTSLWELWGGGETVDHLSLKSPQIAPNKNCGTHAHLFPEFCSQILKQKLMCPRAIKVSGLKWWCRAPNSPFLSMLGCPSRVLVIAEIGVIPSSPVHLKEITVTNMRSLVEQLLCVSGKQPCENMLSWKVWDTEGHLPVAFCFRSIYGQPVVELFHIS